MSFSFRKKLALLLIGSVLIFSGCGTTLTTEDDEKYAPVDKESTLQNEESTKDDKSLSGKSTSSTTAPKAGTTDQIPVTLVSTTDGDTIRVMYKGENEPVRYLLIDTPETNHPRLGKQPFGEEAKELNRQLVTSGDLTLEFDVGEKRDKYGRLLAYVYVDGKSVQETLISNGLARVAYIYPPNTRHLTPYEETQQVAKSKKLGIWAVEDYATDSGFNSGSSTNTDTGSGGSSNPSVPAATTKTTEWFDNCTHLRTKYPNGVASDHPAYQAKMDRDKDNFACER
ncbi:thermonuclease family protein [Paenisporosarcina sp. TG-14]|uniref:thermonuclease family protein n=1 Tax=Paenisporosarcina sp. TG-14 TaxID=1231057 RepID=UPI00030521AE|nr:thermonuclease family protein [Paenisporosarcina sp. TG-14]